MQTNSKFQAPTVVGAMASEILLTLISLLVLTLGILRYWKQSKKYPPGPHPWPFFGNLFLIRRLTRELNGQHRAFAELSRRYSSNLVTLRLGRSDVIAVSGYKAIQQILTSSEFDGRPWNEFAKLRNMGLRKGITMSDGPEWREVRAWLVRSLRKVDFEYATMSAHIKNELQLLLTKVPENGIVSMKSLLAPATINVIWALSTGNRFANHNQLDYFVKLMGRRAEAFDLAGGILSVFPWVRHIAPEASGYNILIAMNDEVKKLLMGTIEERKKTYVESDDRSDLISMFLKEMNSREGKDSMFSDDQLFVILLDLFIAGTVTTRTTLEFMFLRMVVSQDVQQRLQEELDSVVGWDRLPDISDRQRLPYMEAVLTECQRLHLVAPIIGPRRVLRKCTLDGYEIEPEMFMLMNVWSIHMNSEYYPDPESFDPGRFFKDGCYVPDDKLIFFGRGHRRCPGEGNAKETIFMFFAGIMQRFKLLPPPGQGPPDLAPNMGITLSPKPYEIRLVPRHPDRSPSKT